MTHPTTIAPSGLPSLPLADRRDLPDTAAIYFVLAGDAVLYIGQSTSLRQRWVAHHRLKQLNQRGGCRIAWMTVDDAGLLGELERACIAHFSPMLNSELIPGGTRPSAPGETWLAVRIPEDAKEQLEEIAKREERSMSYVVRRYVLEGLGRDEEQQHRA